MTPVRDVKMCQMDIIKNGKGKEGTNEGNEWSRPDKNRGHL